MSCEARVEGGVSVGFRGPVFEDAFVGGWEEEGGGVEVGFGAEGEEGRGGFRVVKRWWERERGVSRGCHLVGGHKELMERYRGAGEK